MRIVFLGPPGAGKGTQAARLAVHLKVPHLSTGEMFRAAFEEKTEIGLLAHKYFSAGKLVPDEVVLQLIEARMLQSDCDEGCVLDGFPRTLGQAKALDIFLEDKGTCLAKTIKLVVSENTLVERLQSRGREDDTEETIKKRLQQYVSLTRPLIEYYKDRGVFEAVPGEGIPDEVAERVQKAASA